jgi:hypothetical protein
MTTKKTDKTWKDALLKTSMPLEYLVAQQLHNLKCGIQGEYHYLRPNEEEILTEFSVDIWSMSHLQKKDIPMWACLHLLVECKYCYPGIKWLFAPHTKSDLENILEIGVISTHDQLCTRQIYDKRPLWRLSNKFPKCYKGVELHSKDATAQNIERGRSQLIYAIPRLAIHLIESQMITFNNEDLDINFICPILVTTADLYVLKDGLDLNDFKKAKTQDDIAIEVPALILTNPYSHLFTNYTDSLISEMHFKKPDIKERLIQLKMLKNKLAGEEDNGLPPALTFDWDIRESAKRILIINYNSLDFIYKLLRKTVVNAGKSLTQVGILKKDMSKRKTWVEETK